MQTFKLCISSAVNYSQFLVSCLRCTVMTFNCNVGNAKILMLYQQLIDKEKC